MDSRLSLRKLTGHHLTSAISLITFTGSCNLACNWSCGGISINSSYYESILNLVRATFIIFCMSLSHKDPLQTANRFDRFGMSNLSKQSKCKSIVKIVYFNCSQCISWLLHKDITVLIRNRARICEYSILFSLSRKEGYIHNLPTKSKFHILPNHLYDYWSRGTTKKEVVAILGYQKTVGWY